MIDQEKLMLAINLINTYCLQQDILMDITITLNRSSEDYPVSYKVKRNDNRGRNRQYLNIEDIISDFYRLTNQEKQK